MEYILKHTAVSGHEEGLGFLRVRANTTGYTTSCSHTLEQPGGRALGARDREIPEPANISTHLSQGFQTLSCEIEHLKTLTLIRKVILSIPSPCLMKSVFWSAPPLEKAAAVCRRTYFVFLDPCASVLQMKFSLTFRMYEILKLK